MELTDLHYFYNVATTRSFAAGAKLSHVTPPAMSKAIKKLEEEVEMDLFLRTTRSVSLTDHGEILLEHCRRVFREVDELKRRLDESTDTLRGDVRIAAMEVFSVYLLPNAMARLVRRHPQLAPRSYAMSGEQMAFALAEGQLDVGFTIGDVDARDVDVHLVAESPGCLVCGPGHPLYENGVVAPEDLEHYPFVVPQFFQREYLPVIDGFPDSRYPRRIGATVELMQMGVQLAIDGAYLGYFPEVTIRCYLAAGTLRALKGLEPGPPIALRALTRAGTTPKAAVRQLIDELRVTVRASLSDQHQCG